MRMMELNKKKPRKNRGFKKSVSGSFYFTGAETGSTDIHFTHAGRCFYFDGFYIGFPYMIGSSM